MTIPNTRIGSGESTKYSFIKRSSQCCSVLSFTSTVNNEQNHTLSESNPDNKWYNNLSFFTRKTTSISDTDKKRKWEKGLVWYTTSCHKFSTSGTKSSEIWSQVTLSFSSFHLNFFPINYFPHYVQSAGLEYCMTTETFQTATETQLLVHATEWKDASCGNIPMPARPTETHKQTYFRIRKVSETFTGSCWKHSLFSQY